MKKAFLLSAFIIQLLSNVASAQIAFFEVNSGFGVNQFPGQETTSSDYKPQYNLAGFIPLQLSIGGGLKKLQLGGELNFYPLHPTYFYMDYLTGEQHVKEVMTDSYWRLFLRYQSANDLHKKTAFIFKAGAGRITPKKEIYFLPEETLYATDQYNKTWIYSADIGLSIPIYSLMNLTLQYELSAHQRTLTYENLTLEDKWNLRHALLIGVNVGYDFKKK